MQKRILEQAKKKEKRRIVAKAKAKKRNGAKLRPTLLDALDTGIERNIYCRRDDLENEAAVEAFFINRVILDLGYRDGQVKTKKSIDSITITTGSKRNKYKPDYILVVDGLPRCVIDAKDPEEDLEEWVEKCSGYCLALNRRQKNNPVRFFVLSNGISTDVYAWDSDDKLLSLSFSEFTWGNAKYERLRVLLSSENVAKEEQQAPPPEDANFSFTRPTAERARQLFSACHRSIWKSEVGSPAFAFMEFVKVMFVKLWADKKLRQQDETRHFFSSGKDTIHLPPSAVPFSVEWIEKREREGAVNPLDTILFETLRADIEQSIELRQKKRLFDKGERIKLRPDTIKDVVSRLEQFDMFGIDEDLNGRLFETFLSATMRGRELGQFFTPRSIVKMMTRLANLQVTRKHQDKVIDGCCGSGGFLIEALTVMRNSIRENSSLSDEDKRELLDRVCNESIYGIDYGKDPPLARIARINMYLHGDGGSRIYYADGLDKKLDNPREKDAEIVQNLQELRESLCGDEPVLFDAVLSNPPFSMTKSNKNETEREILKQYVLARRDKSSAALRGSLRSSVMFMERYTDLLKPGGKLITVIDESILAGPEYAPTRDFIREKFLIRAIISLHGDSFRRSGSRIKTSVLLLEKKRREKDVQPSCFTFFSIRLGVDDLTPRASDDDIRSARALASQEMQDILTGYADYLAGKPNHNVVSADRLHDTLDLKSVVPLFGRMASEWKSQGIQVKILEECVKASDAEINPQDEPDREYKLVKVGYDGRCRIDVVRRGAAIKYKKMHPVKAGQLVFSTIRAVNGAIGVLPQELDGALVSQSYTVFDCGTPEDTAYLWAVLRSHEVRADIQSASTGASRYYSYWPDIGSVPIPWLPEKRRREIGRKFLDTWELERKLRRDRHAASALIHDLGVESEDSIRRWEASKPPE